MDQQQMKDEEIFGLRVDETGKAYMLETARWSKFLGIIGLILTVLFLAGLLFLVFGASEVSRQIGATYGINYGVGMIFFYLLIVLIVFYPSITMLRFANRVKPALNTGNQEQFTEALRNLRNTFKFWGIYVIVLLGIYGISIILVLIVAAMNGF